MRRAFADALPADLISQAVRDFAALGSEAAQSALQVREIGAEIRLLHQGLAEQKLVLDAEASQFQITQNQKFAMLEAETQKEYEAELALLQQEAALGDLSVRQRLNVINQIAALEQRHRTDMIRLDEQAIAQQQRSWTGSLGTIENAFNSQLRGLLAGTTSWSHAFRSILGDLVIKFIEMCETDGGEVARRRTRADHRDHDRRRRPRRGRNRPARMLVLLAQAANAVRAIMTDAAQAFAGVFAFLAPTMGPAAAGPAAAAEASVSAAAIFDVGTDYVVRGGLALIHPGETIVPRRAAPVLIRRGPAVPQMHAPVSINVSALDSQSVARFFNDNSRQMLRAINDAVRRGAHLGMRVS